MSTYIIGYDLNRPHQDYPELIHAIKQFSGWWHHLDSTWIIKSDLSAATIRDQLRQHVDANDELLVIEHQGAAAWVGFNAAGSKWLKDNL